MGRLLPLLLALVGLGLGAGAGLALRPAHEAAPAEAECAQPADADLAEAVAPAAPDPASVEYVKMNNQFVVPVVNDGRVTSLVVLSLSLEIASGQQEQIYQREPKLRDAFLQVMFDHANSGGFDGAFTNGRNMVLLRDALRESAVKILGGAVSDVLIVDVVRQDA